MLVAALILFLKGLRGDLVGPRWIAVVYRAVIAVVLVGPPIGVALAFIRHG